MNGKQRTARQWQEAANMADGAAQQLETLRNAMDDRGTDPKRHIVSWIEHVIDSLNNMATDYTHAAKTAPGDPLYRVVLVDRRDNTVAHQTEPKPLEDASMWVECWENRRDEYHLPLMVPDGMALPFADTAGEEVEA